eukprot:m.145293 g.145293  ORF g.145293 m.145293 type:complete len:87 (+) comp16216_c2_seq11:52-312(+)
MADIRYASVGRQHVAAQLELMVVSKEAWPVQAIHVHLGSTPIAMGLAPDQGDMRAVVTTSLVNNTLKSMFADGHDYLQPSLVPAID